MYQYRQVLPLPRSLCFRSATGTWEMQGNYREVRN
jgi:hypothetical protein